MEYREPTYHKYDPILNGIAARCAVCNRVGVHHQHHVAHRRYSDLCIWVCNKHHRMIHEHPEWAYKYKFLVKHNTMAKEACKHTSSFFDPQLGYIRCQYCRKKVDTLSFGKSGKGKPKESYRSPNTKKMGYEVENAKTIKMAKMRNQYTAIKAKIKQNSNDPSLVKVLEKQKTEMEAQMAAVERLSVDDVENTYDD